MIFKRATNQVQKNTNNYIKWKGLDGIRLALSTLAVTPKIKFNDNCLVFGTAKEDGKAPEYILFFDIEDNMWCSAWYEEHLEHIAEWEFDESLYPDVLIAIIAATGLEDLALCKKLSIRESTLKKWLESTEQNIIPVKKLRLLHSLISSL